LQLLFIRLEADCLLKASDDGSEPILFFRFLRCMRSQRQKCRVSERFGAAAQRQERTLKPMLSDVWDPISHFLHVPVPQSGFPRGNANDEFLSLTGSGARNYRIACPKT